jgi:hypothetical protein
MAVDDAFTVFLAHMDGADASTTFTDEAGKTLTANGDAQIDTAQSKFGGASGLFDGTGDFVTAADSNDWLLDDGSNSNLWTVDFWVRFNGDPGTATQGFISHFQDVSNFWNINLTNNNLRFAIRTAGVTTVTIDQAWDPATATWYHVAIVKNGTTGYLHFIDGTQIGSTTTDTDPISNMTGNLRIAKTTASTGVESFFAGWMDELRISKGVARWTANFTPPTEPYTPVGGFFF